MRLLFANIFLISMMSVLHGEPIPDPDPENIVIQVKQEVYGSGCGSGCGTGGGCGTGCGTGSGYGTGDNDKDNEKDHDKDKWEGGVCFHETTPECEDLDGKCYKREKGCPDFRPAAVEGICSKEFDCVCCAKEDKVRERNEGGVCFANTTPECEALDGKCHPREKGCSDFRPAAVEGICSEEFGCVCCAKEDKVKEKNEGAHCFANTTPECEALNGKCHSKEKGGCTHGQVEVGNGTCGNESCICCAKEEEKVDDCDGPANGGCEQICTNTDDGPVCSCSPGSVLTSDGKTCYDV